VEVTVVPPVAKLEQVFAIGNRGLIRKAVERHDIAHIHGMWEGLLAQAASTSVATGKPYIHSPHGMLDEWALSVGRTKKRVALACGFRKIPKLAGAVIVSNAHERECVERGRYSSKVELVPHGVNLAALDKGQEGGAGKEGNGVAGGSPYVLFLGRLHSVKGLQLLTEAFAEIAKEFANHKLVLAGPDEGEAAALRELAGALGLAARVVQPGPLWGIEKARALRGAACFCLLSEHENFGLSLAEAMACSCPVVASRQCHFDDIATEGAGLIVERTRDAAAGAMRSILRNPVVRAAMGRAGRQLVEQRFTWPAICARFEEISGRVIAASAGMRG
jgi:glycosyltransferase involved in cell wall biosynthesis